MISMLSHEVRGRDCRLAPGSDPAWTEDLDCLKDLLADFVARAALQRDRRVEATNDGYSPIQGVPHRAHVNVGTPLHRIDMVERIVANRKKCAQQRYEPGTLLAAHQPARLADHPRQFPEARLEEAARQSRNPKGRPLIPAGRLKSSTGVSSKSSVLACSIRGGSAKSHAQTLTLSGHLGPLA